MTAYGPTPISENNGTSLGIGYVRIEKDATGAITRGYWNHALEVYEVGPRVDAKHVLPHQRLSDDVADVDNVVQLADVARRPLETPNVIVVIYNIDSTGKATGVYTTYGHNIATALGSVNTANY